jgi:hypothetical protein
MYVPVYHRGMPVDTVAQRRAAIRGWVYSPYRMNDLLQGILGGPGLKRAQRLHLASWFSLAGGALISLLLFALVRSLQDTRARAQAMADHLTDTLRVRGLPAPGSCHGAATGGRRVPHAAHGRLVALACHKRSPGQGCGRRGGWFRGHRP